jgi:hypothetical protein
MAARRDEEIVGFWKTPSSLVAAVKTGPGMTAPEKAIAKDEKKIEASCRVDVMGASMAYRAGPV